MSTEPVRLERRSGQRFQQNLPVTVHVNEVAFPGYTQDISARGLFVYVEAQVSEGQTVELTFTMPSEITLAENMRVRARGRVLRSSLASGSTGIAVQLDSYQYLPSPNYESAEGVSRLATENSDRESTGAIPR